MNNRELKIKTISNEFARWQIQIQNLNSLNLYDANLFSETSICNILNTVFDYELQNANQIQKNYPAIDLFDKTNRIAVQVTATKSKSKIQTTLDRFFENRFHENFDELLIIVLGNRQKNYSGLDISDGFEFFPDKHILDFKDLLKHINFLPTKRINNIAELLEQEDISKIYRKPSKNAVKIKRNLALKKKLKNDFLFELDQKYWRQAIYEPYINFKYHNVIIRSIDDTSWPNTDEAETGKMSSWFKGECWDFYDNGLELISLGGDAIFDKDGNWDILNWRGDNRENNELYKTVSYTKFLRIPYEYIVTYDMEPDPYNSVPTIFVEYANDEMPYEEILYGVPGQYVKDNESNSRLTYYFENSKRKILQ